MVVPFDDSHSLLLFLPPSLPTTATHLRTKQTLTTTFTQSQLDKGTNLRLAMAESKPNDKTTNSLSVKEVKAPNLLERAKEEFEAILHHRKSSCHHTRETNGLHNGIDENTSLDDVRAPNVFERAKEEFEALAQVLHHKKESPTHDRRDDTQMAESSKHKQEITSPLSEINAKAANLFGRAKEEIEAVIHHDKSLHHHHKETHGMSDDIDENTPSTEVKGPNVFERVKEEFEAIFQEVHHKKER